MKIYLHSDFQEQIKHSGVGRALLHQQAALEKENIPYTLTDTKDWDLVHINTIFPNSYRIAKKAHHQGKAVVYHAHSTLTYVEAMASGLPALCRKDESITGVIQDGENGFQYQEFSAFKKHLKDLINDTDYRMKLGANAREFAFENYSAETFANKVVQVYKQAKENYEMRNRLTMRK